MKVLVTGGTGVLGREVVAAAESAGHVVRVASRRALDGSPATREQARMELATGEGVAEGVAGVDAIIHAASDPRRAEVDVAGTRHLAEAARAAGVGHLVYVSIVGVDRIPFGYYRRKLVAEHIVGESGVPYSILRATQFHEFIDTLLSAAARLPLVIPLPTSFKVQSVAAAEVAARLVRALGDGPGERLPDLGGPELLTLGEAAEQWKRARGVRKRVLPLPLPGALAAAFRQGKNTAPGAERGSLRWADWLATAVVAVLALLLGAGAVAAQEADDQRFEIGAGVGYGQVSSGGSGRSMDDVQYHARAGWRFSSLVALAVEMGWYATHDEDPLPSDVGVDANGQFVVHRTPKVLRTSTAILSLRVGRRTGLYLRPGLGFGSHAYAVYGPGYVTPIPQFTEAERSREIGPALSLAAGYQVALVPALKLSVEAITVWSGGEDSSSGRRVVGVQVVPLLTF